MLVFLPFLHRPRHRERTSLLLYWLQALVRAQVQVPVLVLALLLVLTLGRALALAFEGFGALFDYENEVLPPSEERTVEAKCNDEAARFYTPMERTTTD